VRDPEVVAVDLTKALEDRLEAPRPPAPGVREMDDLDWRLSFLRQDKPSLGGRARGRLGDAPPSGSPCRRDSVATGPPPISGASLPSSRPSSRPSWPSPSASRAAAAPAR